MKELDPEDRALLRAYAAGRLTGPARERFARRVEGEPELAAALIAEREGVQLLRALMAHEQRKLQLVRRLRPLVWVVSIALGALALVALARTLLVVREARALQASVARAAEPGELALDLRLAEEAAVVVLAMPGASAPERLLPPPAAPPFEEPPRLPLGAHRIALAAPASTPAQLVVGSRSAPLDAATMEAIDAALAKGAGVEPLRRVLTARGFRARTLQLER